MHGATGFHTWRNVDDMLKRKREAARKARKRHRALPKHERLLKDLYKVQDALVTLTKATSTPRRLQKYGPARKAREARTLLRQWNRLVDMLNKYNGTSQKVAREVVS
jgi:hypothetical protein